jgi:hypothetical protein
MFILLAGDDMNYCSKGDLQESAAVPADHCVSVALSVTVHIVAGVATGGEIRKYTDENLPQHERGGRSATCLRFHPAYKPVQINVVTYVCCYIWRRMCPSDFSSMLELWVQLVAR